MSRITLIVVFTRTLVFKCNVLLLRLFLKHVYVQIAKLRKLHSKLPLLEIVILSLLTSCTQLLLPFLGTCQPCAEMYSGRMQHAHSPRAGVSLVNAQDHFSVHGANSGDLPSVAKDSSMDRPIPYFTLDEDVKGVY